MGFYFTEIENGIVECAEQDQTAHLWSQEKRN